MFLRRRGILIGIGILALATVSLAATVRVYFFQLPEPEEADGRGLIRWMVTKDLSQESPELRRRLLVRMKAILGGNKLDFSSIDDRLDPEYRPRFWSNVDVLLQEWFYLQADRYAAAAPRERTAILDKILDEAQALGNLQPNATPSKLAQKIKADTNAGSSAKASSQPAIESRKAEGKKPDPIAAAAKFIEKMNVWIERAPPVDQPEVRHFAAALQARMAVRSLQGLMKAFQPDQPAARP